MRTARVQLAGWGRGWNKEPKARYIIRGRHTQKLPHDTYVAKNLLAIAMANLALTCRLPWWSGFSLALVLPVTVLIFLLSGPHGIASALLWTLPVCLLIAADHWAPSELRPVPRTAPRWFFDGILYGLAALQLINLIVLGMMVSRLHWTGTLDAVTALTNLLAMRILVGTNVCCAVIAPAHELMHRRSHWQRWLGRLLLMTVCYDHFFVAHRLGHHARLGSQEDPSTAETHESYEEFFRRSLRRQWQIAWQRQPRSLARGLILECALMAFYLMAFGGLAAFMLGYVNLVAVRLLEAVNYFQHFGLTLVRGQSRVTAWRCDSAVSLFLFLGLTRHADHHRHPAKTYPELVDSPNGPHLPLGYLGMAIWVKNDSKGYRKWALRGLAASKPQPGMDGDGEPGLSAISDLLPPLSSDGAPIA